MSPARRRSERLKVAADHARAFDKGRDAAQSAISVVDAFVADRAIAVAKQMIALYDAEIELSHRATVENALDVTSGFSDYFGTFKERMTEEAEAALGEWKYVLIQTDAWESMQAYVAKKLDEIVAGLDDHARTQLGYAFLRIEGKISDAEHAMTPEEFKAQLAPARMPSGRTFPTR